MINSLKEGEYHAMKHSAETLKSSEMVMLPWKNMLEDYSFEKNMQLNLINSQMKDRNKNMKAKKTCK